MKATVLQENLAKALSVVSRAVATKPAVAVLANILLKEEGGGLQLSATNLEIGVRLGLPAKIEKEFAITIPAKLLTEFVSGMPKGQIEMEIKEGKLSISGKGFKAEMPGIEASEFPVIPLVSGQETISISKEALSHSLAGTVFAAGTDDSRPVLTGVLVETQEKGLVIVATDGYRLSKADLLGSKVRGKMDTAKILVPARAVSEILRMTGESDEDEIKIWLSKEANQVIFKVGEVELVSRLIEGNFPDYEKIIPGEGKTKFWVDKEEFTRAVKLAAIFARESANVVKFKVTDGKLLVSANSPQIGGDEGEVEIKKEGEDAETAFNYRYLSEFLGNVKGDTIVFESSGPLSPGVFREEGNSTYLHIIMPVRVQQ